MGNCSKILGKAATVRTGRSANPVVRNAMDEAARNAAAVKGGNYEVTLETVTLKGNVTATAVMTDSQLKTWLGLIRSGWMYGDALTLFANGGRNYRENVDMHPTVRIRPM